MSGCMRSWPSAMEYLPFVGMRLVHEAWEFAEAAHAGQYRASGEPFIEHPLAVAHILVSQKTDAPTLAAAFLHDVVEDTPTSLKEICECFGTEVAQLVDGVTTVADLASTCNEQTDATVWNATMPTRLAQAIRADCRVAFIRLADRLHNMRTLGSLSVVRQRQISWETFTLYVPLARVIGIHAFRDELRALALAHLSERQRDLLRTGRACVAAGDMTSRNMHQLRPNEGTKHAQVVGCQLLIAADSYSTHRESCAMLAGVTRADLPRFDSSQWGGDIGKGRKMSVRG